MSCVTRETVFAHVLVNCFSKREARIYKTRLDRDTRVTTHLRPEANLSSGSVLQEQQLTMPLIINTHGHLGLTKGSANSVCSDISCANDTQKTPRMQMPISVLLADDNDIIRRAPSHPLSLRSDMKVVGEDADFTETLLMIEGLNPMSLS
jgi:hypothetical protein